MQVEVKIKGPAPHGDLPAKHLSCKQKCPQERKPKGISMKPYAWLTRSRSRRTVFKRFLNILPELRRVCVPVDGNPMLNSDL